MRERQQEEERERKREEDRMQEGNCKGRRRGNKDLEQNVKLEQVFRHYLVTLKLLKQCITVCLCKDIIKSNRGKKDGWIDKR